jgi:hypothetical protein
MFNFGLVEGARGGRGGAGMSDFGCFSSVEAPTPAPTQVGAGRGRDAERKGIPSL